MNKQQAKNSQVTKKVHGSDFLSNLSQLIDPQLKKYVISKDKDQAVNLCDESKSVNLAALISWFELHQPKKYADDLMYYCWLNHPAFDVTCY